MTHSDRVISGALAGIATRKGSPARAQNAAQAAPAFPFVGMATPAAPSSAARETPTAAPRALKLAVGSGPSSLISSRGRPRARPERGPPARDVGRRYLAGDGGQVVAGEQRRAARAGALQLSGFVAGAAARALEGTKRRITMVHAQHPAGPVAVGLRRERIPHVACRCAAESVTWRPGCRRV